MHRSRVALLAPLLFGVGGIVFVACGGGETSPVGDPPPDPAPFGLDQRPPLAALQIPLSDPQPSAVDLEPAFPDLAFTRPGIPHSVSPRYPVSQGHGPPRWTPRARSLQAGRAHRGGPRQKPPSPFARAT